MRNLVLDPRRVAVSPGQIGDRNHAIRLAIVVTHPIQYFTPMFRRLAERPEIELTVLYADLMGTKPFQDPGFGQTFAWDVPLLEGYRCKVLRNYRPERVEGFFSFLTPGIVTEISKERYDAVVIFGWGHLTCWLAFLTSRLRGIPWMLYGDTISIYENDKTGLMRAVRKRLLRSLFRRTAAFLVTGTFNRRFYELYGAGARRCFEVPLAIDDQSFTGKADSARARREEIRAAYGIPSDVLLLLFVGKLLPRKRPQDMLAVLKAYQSQLPQLGLAFVGDGSLMGQLKSAAATQQIENVFFLGFQNQSVMPNLYGAADIFVLPSSYDNKPLVVNEAMACGLPVIVSDRTGVWGPDDIVRDGENGLVYRCGDIAALGQAVQRLALDSELRRRMSRRSIEIIQNYGYDRCVDGVLKAVQFIQGDEPLLSGPPASDA